MALPKIGKAISSLKGGLSLSGGKGTTAAMIGIGAIGLTQRNSRSSYKRW